MAQKQPQYLSYLLRLWRESGDEKHEGESASAVWRASLETASGESHGFAGVDDLCSFLRGQIGALPRVEPACPQPKGRTREAGTS